MDQRNISEMRTGTKVCIKAAGIRYVDPHSFVTEYLDPILGKTSSLYRFMIVFMDIENRVLSHQTLGLCLPPDRPLHLKRLVSLAAVPPGAVRCVFVSSRRNDEPKREKDVELETASNLWSIAYKLGLDMIDFISWGRSGTYGTCGCSRCGTYGHGWEFQSIHAAKRRKNKTGELEVDHVQ